MITAELTDLKELVEVARTAERKWDTPKIFTAIVVLHELEKIKDRVNVSEVTYYSRTTYSHIHKGMRMLEVEGVIRTERWGRELALRLTDKGNNIAIELKKLFLMIK